MRRISVILAVTLLVVSAGSCAYGFTHSFAPQKITGIDLDAVNKLFARAMDNESEDREADPKAQYELGVLFFTMYQAANFEGSREYDEAKSYAKTYNLNQAAYWLRLAAVWGDYAPAQYLLGNIYFWYLGDHDAAYTWLDKSANNGYARAQAQRADLYKNAHDYAKALDFARKSAKQGDAFGMYVLSALYGDNRYTGYDKAKSEEWRKKAIDASKTDPTINFDDEADDFPVIRTKRK